MSYTIFFLSIIIALFIVLIFCIYAKYVYRYSDDYLSYLIIQYYNTTNPLPTESGTYYNCSEIKRDGSILSVTIQIKNATTQTVVSSFQDMFDYSTKCSLLSSNKCLSI